MRWMNTHYVICSLVVMVLLLTACGGGGGGGGGADVNIVVVADSGKNQYISTGSRVLLDASDSQGFDIDNQQQTTVNYTWQLVKKPSRSQSVLDNANIATPFFIPDVNGEYEFKLTVSKNDESEESTVKVVASSGNSQPVATVGRDFQSIPGKQIILDGSQSSDANDDQLSYLWIFENKPDASQASLIGADTVNPEFTPDVVGIYKIQLVVNDGQADSETVIITIDVKEGNANPLALGGKDIHANMGQEISLNGNQSSDANDEVLLYRWFFSSVPANSVVNQASLNNSNTATPVFTPDQAGTYILTLQVIDTSGETDFDSVVVFIATANDLPVPHAGFDQTVNTGVKVILNGAGSYDANQDEMTYRWTAIAPGGSQAEIQNADQRKASLVPDEAGEYIVTLVVADAAGDSSPVSIKITAERINRAPVAKPGDDATVLVNTEVILNADKSTDEDGDTLSHLWSMKKQPDDSSVALIDANTASTRFTPDQAGQYIVQLVVNDGTVDSQTANVTTTVIVEPPSPQLPVAILAPVVTGIQVGDTVNLNGSLVFPVILNSFKITNIDCILLNPRRSFGTVFRY